MIRLKEIRTEKRLTQQEAADLLGCPRYAYARYERGEREPSIDMLIQLAHCFNVTVDYLIGNENHLDMGLTQYEQQLLMAARDADQRAREDALSMLVSHRVEVKKELFA